ncbi:Translation initiation factor 2B, gamma subunit (eIF-2Bgamma/GCD1) [Ceraceosorus bombacis]|uniref:Translation initiation factor 2B, gamma subunit (EIF-2Bgamma/GCD1) n=1 Tax=Ceraceosorus bombacis TaxID=401625 RepID=A0A0N7LAT3_9BASI|nr:Translation initiation factor 2B, gamma subunit (eIF-2Bgamma/GCD1) [Ceraceosorus bombacis]
MSWPSLLTPVLFSGTGEGLYPLCDSTYDQAQGEASTSARGGGSGTSLRPLSKALLPLANRPVAAYALQSILTSLPDCRYALLFAPCAEHADISKTLQAYRLLLPPSHRSKQASLQPNNTRTAAKQAQSNSIAIHIVDGLKVRPDPSPSQLDHAAASSLPGLPPSRASDTFKVHLLPLGPYEKELAGDASAATMQTDAANDDDGDDDDDKEEEAKGKDYRRIPKLGTAELLRWAFELGKVESDPLVLPIDLLNPYSPLTRLIAAHIEAGIGSIAQDEDADQIPKPALTCMLYEAGAGDGTGKEREKEGPAKLLCAYSADSFKQEMGHCLSSPASSLSSSTDAVWGSLRSSHRLLHLSHLSDNEDGLALRYAVAQRTNKLRVSTNLLDSHIYILDKRKTERLLKARRALTSLREHVVPLLIKAGYQRGLWDKAVRSGPDARQDAKEDADDEFGDGDAAKPLHALSTALQQSSVLIHPNAASVLCGRSTVGGSKRDGSASRAASSITCVALIQRLDVPSDYGAQAHSPAAKERRFFARANTVPTFLECNRWLLKALSSPNSLPQGFALPISTFEPNFIEAQQINPSAQVSSDTILPFAPRFASDAAGVETFAGASSSSSSSSKHQSLLTLGDRCALKKCIVGPGCVVGKGAKLTGCVLMQGVKVGDNVKLDSVILCPGATIGDRCNLKDCDVATGVHVLPDTQAKNEKITVGAASGGSTATTSALSL